LGDSGRALAWRRGRLTAFVERHTLIWELTMAALTIVYVVLAFLQDQGFGGAVTVGVGALAVIFVVEFSARCYDATSRLIYFKRHWIDIVTCIPVAGSLRALRLLRLLAFLRLGAAVRAFGVGVAASERIRGGSMLWVVGPTLLIVWIGAAYGYYELEGGVNPKIQTFTDALFFALITASTVGYGDVTPVTEAGKVLTGILIFLGIGLLGFASAQLTAKLLPQESEFEEIRTELEHQSRLLEDLAVRMDALRESLGTPTERRRERATAGELQENLFSGD
jgi:voltage-gated potassium channel